MKKTLLIVLLNAAFATFVATAQTAGTPPTPAEQAQRRVDHLTRVLTLTAAQQQQALTIFTNAATAQAELRDSMKTARDAVSAAVKVNDIATIERNATTIGTLTAQQVSIESKADAALYLILTAEQREKLPEMRGPGGPGGFGFGPGGAGGRGAERFRGR